VELVDDAGRPVGAMSVAEAHRSPGARHRAFSVLLRDDAGRVLLQRRAAVKTRFPLRWANSCCGHPLPGEPVTVAAARRLAEELGIVDVALTEIGVYAYRADDPDTGRVEYEYDHVVLGRVAADAPVDADPAEVAELRWAPAADLPARIAADPGAYAPWLAGVLAVLAAPGPDPGARVEAPSGDG